MFGWLKKLLARREEPMPAAYGIGGHGLLLAVPVDTRALLDPEGSLTLVLADVLVRVIPGAEPASTTPTFDGEAWTTGPRGPRIVTPAGQEALDSVLLRVDVGLGSAPWTVLLAGVWVALPPCATVFTRTAQLTDTEWHLLPPEHGAFFSFEHRAGVMPGEVVLRPAVNQSQCGDGHLEGTDGAVRWVELTYEHDGESWRQRFYVASWPGGSLLARAQAPEPQAVVMWLAVEHALRSLEPA